MNNESKLKEFYLIADELNKNIIKFNELEERLQILKDSNDFELIETILKEYKEVSYKIKVLKEQSKKLLEDT